MFRRILFAGLLVFVAWEILDFIIHGVILRGFYEAAPALWRPMSEIKMGILVLAVAISALCFSAIYGWLVAPKGMDTAVRYGLIFGIGSGVAMGYGTYAVMPIPYWMALTWFLGTLVQALIGGIIVGAIVRGPSGV